MTNTLKIKAISKAISLIFTLYLGASGATNAAPLVDNLIFSHNTSKLIYTNRAGTKITAMDTQTGKILHEVDINLPLRAKLINATPDGFKLLLTSPKGISVIHNGTGKILRTLPHPQGYKITKKRHLMVQNKNGSLIAIPYTKGNKTTIFTIHTGSGKIINPLDLDKVQPIQSIGFSQDNRLLAYTHRTMTGLMLFVYDLYRKKPIESILLLRHRYQSKQLSHRLEFSPNGKKILLAFKDKISVADRQSEMVHDWKVYNADAVFSANSRNIIYKSSAAGSFPTVVNLASGQKHTIQTKTKKTSFKLLQSFNKNLIAIPLAGSTSFILLNGHGKLVRVVEEKQKI
ncbi:MAG: hypothetical protein KAH22_00205 [Thiotrichaceae bacterium]|nr:hypothetical protein [Thiotrichaceae bacterium]